MVAPLKLTGKKIHGWEVLSQAPSNRFGNTIWWCKCVCGTVKKITGTQLVQNRSRRCMACRNFKTIPSVYWHRLAASAAKRQIPFEVTKEYLFELFLTRGSKCVYTDLPLHFSAKNRGNAPEDIGNASLDRIDSDKGYVVGNVQWVHKDINRMKWEFSEARFLELCRLVAAKVPG